jgi:hypothetical protein
MGDTNYKVDNNYGNQGWDQILTNTQRNTSSARLDPASALAQLIAINQGNIASLQGTPMNVGGSLGTEMREQNKVLQNHYNTMMGQQSGGGAAPSGGMASASGGSFGIERQQAQRRAEEEDRIRREREAIRFALERQMTQGQIQGQQIRNNRAAQGNPYMELVRQGLSKIMARYL